MKEKIRLSVFGQVYEFDSVQERDRFIISSGWEKSRDEIKSNKKKTGTLTRFIFWIAGKRIADHFAYKDIEIENLQARIDQRDEEIRSLMSACEESQKLVTESQSQVARLAFMANGAVPNGTKLMPITPSYRMVLAGQIELNKYMRACGLEPASIGTEAVILAVIGTMYVAMGSAAPTDFRTQEEVDMEDAP